MGDIDFDELDKAVNNLMGNVKDDPKADKDEVPKAKTLEVKDTLKPGEEPTYNKLGEAAKKIGGESIDTDREQVLVEHFEPKEAADTPEFKKLGEVARNIGSETLGSGRDDAIIKNMAASQAGHKPEVKTDSKVEPRHGAKPSTEERISVNQPARAPASRRSAPGRFMDVVHPSSDMRTAPTRPAAAAANRSETVEMPRPNPTPTHLDAEAADQELTTPFLPDAKEKVEKRPLGAVSTAMWDEPKIEEEPEKPAEVAETEPIEPEVEPAPAPEPESEPVVETAPINSEAVEKKQDMDDQQHSIDAAEILTEESQEEQALSKIESQEAIEALVETPEIASETIESVESGDTEDLRNSGDKDSKEKAEATQQAGAIYDVAEYHKPLHPKKQKTGWGKIVIIVLIILICAALGGAAYFISGMGL